MNAKIRKAKRKDCKRMLELVYELARYEKAEEEILVSLNEFEEDGFGKSPVWEAFVAEQDGFIVGMSLFYTRYSTWKGKQLYLEDFIITEAYRKKGIGKMLFERTLYASKKRGYRGMIWQVLDWNKPAIDFYKRYKAEFNNQWVNVTVNHSE